MADRIVIIGAGPAGLTAAYKMLKETDYKPLILEETSYIGGISRTHEYNGNRMDLGGHRFFSKNEEVMNIWKELMPIQGAFSKDDILICRETELQPGGPDPEQEDKVLLRRRRVSRIYFLRKFFDYPISLKYETFANMGFLRTMKAGFGYIASCIKKRKVNSLEDFYINRFGKPLYEMFFEDYTEKLWGIHPSKIAPDWGAQRVKELSLFGMVKNIIMKPFRKNNEVATSLIEEFYYPKKGPGQLWETMADEIINMGGEILYNTKVVKINYEDNKIVSVEAEKENEETIKLDTRAVFSSMPIKDLIKGIGEKAPRNVKYISENLPYRDFITVGLLVNKLKIKNNSKLKTVSDIVPDCWIYIQERNVKLGRLQIFNNWSPYMVKDFENTVWLGLEYFCNENDSMWNMSEREFTKFAIDEIIEIGIISKEDILDSTMLRVKKAYPAYFGVYKDFNEVINYIDTIDNLYCIGRNGQHRYNNMDHSMLTAIEAVRAFCGNKDLKKNIWNVNTEEEYHESK